MKPRVFVVNEPLRRDPATGQMGRMMDLHSAEEYGQIVHLLPAGPVPSDMEWLFDQIVNEMEEQQFGFNDYLLPVGDQAAIMMAAIEAARRTNGRFHSLRWNGHLRRYFVNDIYSQ